MSVGVLERPATGSVPAPSSRWHPGPPGHGPLGLAPLPARVAPAAAHPPPHRGGGGGRRRRCRGGGQHAAAANAGFGTAHDMATFNLSTPTSKAPAVTLAACAGADRPLEQRFGRVQVIENETFDVPGSNQTYQLRSQDPHGPYGGPMLQLLSGSYPTGSDQVAVTPGLASELNLSVGDTWPQGGKTVVGIVQNPQSLLDEFALVPPGQVTHPTEVTRPLRRAPAASKNLPSYVTPRRVDQRATASTRRPSCWPWRPSACS